jgi:hypothetical protein
MSSGIGISGITSSEHRQLLALWAVVLLVHLSRQDTMTAYSLEDNRLWKRHLLTLLAQAAGVIYVLATSRGRDPRLPAATALMFIVGLIKYAERIFVLFSLFGGPKIGWSPRTQDSRTNARKRVKARG